MTISLAAWLQTFLLFETRPQALRLAREIVLLEGLTKTSLEHSALGAQEDLLNDLANQEGIRIEHRQPSDLVLDLPNTRLNKMMVDEVKRRLGAAVTVAGMVNGQVAIWVSFEVDSTPLWLRLGRDRLDHFRTVEWLGWAVIGLMVSLLGAAAISSVVIRPVSRLTLAASKLLSGERPAPVPESGPSEIRILNQTFNQLVKELQAAEEQRALILAGISHDLRTPLSRLRLEIELSHIEESARTGMVADIEQMDKIVGQFLEFARPRIHLAYDAVHLGIWLRELLHLYLQADAKQAKHIELKLELHDEDLLLEAPLLDLSRAIINLVENARLYGATEPSDIALVTVRSHLHRGGLQLDVIDQGPGVPESSLEAIRRPFMRLDASRGSAGHSGLGLSIVDQLMERCEGKLTLSNQAQGGFMASIWLPLKATTSLREV